jgi:hypothetical protein
MAILLPTEKNIKIYAVENYINKACLDEDEFWEDFNKIKYVKRLLGRYIKEGELKERLILNHLISFYNVFRIESANRMLFLKVNEDFKKTMSKEQLNEFIKIADTAFALRLLRLMTMPVEKTGAYKAGIIDKEYKRIKDVKDFSLQDKKVYTMFHKLAFNLRKLIRKVPLVGKLSVSSYLAALWLIKDHTEMSDDEIKNVLTEVTDINDEDIPLLENSLFINKFSQLEKGTYILNKNLLIPITGEELVRKGTEVIVNESCKPCGSILGAPVFEVYHPKTKSKVYVTPGDLENV